MVIRMQSKVSFGVWESVSLLVSLISTQIFLGFPRSMVETAGTASWILIIYVTVLALVGFYIISRLYKGFEGCDLLDISEKAGGGVVRIFVGCILLVYLIFIISIVLREYAENMKAVAFPVSPISFITLFFITGMVLAAYFGLEAIVRISAYIVPIIIMGYLLILIGVMPYYEFSNILPILGAGPYSIFGKGSLRLSIYSAVSILFIIAPFIKGYGNFKKIGYLSIGMSGGFFLVTSIIYVMVFSYPMALESFLPVYQLARLIYYGRFFERIESMFMIVWAGSALLYLSAGFYFILYVFKKTFKLEYYRPLIFPFALLIFTISFLPHNLISALTLEEVYFRNYIWIVTFVMPMIILLLARYVKRNAEKEGKKRA